MKYIIIVVLAISMMACSQNNQKDKLESNDSQLNVDSTNEELVIPTIDSLVGKYELKVINVFNESNKVAKVHYFKDSVLVYEARYHSNGELNMYGRMKDNKRTGQWKAWYDTKQLWSEGTYIDGLREGDAFIYHPNGSLFYSQKYIKGKLDGVTNIFNEDGKRVTQVTYDNGKIVNEITY